MTADDRTETWTEAERLAALRAYGVLHTAPEPRFDDLVELAAAVCEAPTALISLVDSDMQWFKARVGLEVECTPRSLSFCDHAMREHGVMVVPDARLDMRFADNALVTGPPHIRFYAGAPLVTGEGLPIGSLCVIDYQPRPAGLTPLQSRTLSVLAHQVMNQLELRRALEQRDASDDAARRALLASDYVGAWDWDIVSDRMVADDRFATMYGVDPSLAARGAPIEIFARRIDPRDQDRVAADIARATAGDGVFL